MTDDHYVNDVCSNDDGTVWILCACEWVTGDCMTYATAADCYAGHVSAALRSQVATLSAELGRVHLENQELRAEVNGTEWENNLLLNAPDWLDGDVAQSELVTEYVRWLESRVSQLEDVVEAARVMLDTMHPQGYAQSGPRRNLAVALARLDTDTPDQPTEHGPEQCNQWYPHPETPCGIIGNFPLPTPSQGEPTTDQPTGPTKDCPSCGTGWDFAAHRSTITCDCGTVVFRPTPDQGKEGEG